MHLKFTIPSSSNIHYTATPLRVSQSWLCHNFTAAVKPRELNEKPSSPSPSSLESRAQSSSAELNQREAIKFSYCPMQPQPCTALRQRGDKETRRAVRSAHGKSSFHWKRNDSDKKSGTSDISRHVSSATLEAIHRGPNLGRGRGPYPSARQQSPSMG